MAQAKEASLSLRIPVELDRRIKVLEEHMATTPDGLALNIRRAGIIRMALARGVESLEEQYGLSTSTPAEKKKGTRSK